jgi:diaminopimelate decarboxylase
VGAALDKGAVTPFYLFSAEPIRAALERLDLLQRALPVPVRHWLSCKTQPVPPLLRWWRRQGRPIEVVSEFEYHAARAAGFPTDLILLNGPAKHRWLPQVAAPGLRVNFDSPNELAALLPLARRLDWRCGVRVRTREEFDPEFPAVPTQFGFDFAGAVAALRRLRRARVRIETIHFHLRTNVASASVYARAVEEVVAVCRAAAFTPRFLDCGGGLPPAHTRSRSGRRFGAGFALERLARVLRRGVLALPGLEELWLENGRFLSAGAGALVVTVLDAKRGGRWRQLICDGGRTLHALVSLWEEHELLPVPARRGPTVPTVVYGPTCMAFDQLARRWMPAGIRPGDGLVWFEAGAYHLAWETRFSHGTAAVWWHEEDRLWPARPAESFGGAWRRWRPDPPGKKR